MPQRRRAVLPARDRVAVSPARLAREACFESRRHDRTQSVLRSLVSGSLEAHSLGQSQDADSDFRGGGSTTMGHRRPSPMHSKPPKVVMVIGSLMGGGAERQMANIANYWAKRDIHVTLATWSGPEIADFYRLDDKVRRVYLDVPKNGDRLFSALHASVRRVAKLRRLLLASRPDAVLSFVTESNVLTILARVGLETRLVVSERVNPALHAALPWKWKALRRVVYRWADEVVAQTRATAGWVGQNCRKTALVIPNGLYQLPHLSVERQPLILAVGRLVNQKGFDLLVRAFARIASDFRDWRVMFIGDGDERSRLMRLCRDLEVEERVMFAGQR